MDMKNIDQMSLFLTCHEKIKLEITNAKKIPDIVISGLIIPQINKSKLAETNLGFFAQPNNPLSP